jgi:hypothetical protein
MAGGSIGASEKSFKKTQERWYCTVILATNRTSMYEEKIKGNRSLIVNVTIPTAAPHQHVQNSRSACGDEER